VQYSGQVRIVRRTTACLVSTGPTPSLILLAVQDLLVSSRYAYHIRPNNMPSKGA